MDITLFIYAVVVMVGLVVCAIAWRSPASALALWMVCYPLFADVTVPEGFDKFPPTRIVHLMILGVLLVTLRRRREWLGPRSPIWAYMGFVCAAIISAFWSDLRAESATRALAYAEPAIWMLLGMLSMPKQEARREVGSVLLAAALGFGIVVLLAIPEVTRQESYLARAGLVRVDRDYMQDLRLGISGRIGSTIGQPVFAGIFGMVGVAIAHLLWLWNRRGGLYKRLIAVCTLVGGTAFVFLTGTRAAIISLALYPLIFVLLLRPRRGMLRLLVGYGLVIAFVVTVVPERFADWMSSSFELSAPTAASANVLGRVALTKRLLDIFVAHPLLGVGPGYVQKAVFVHGNTSLTGLEGVESQYAAILAENGLVGFLMLALFYTQCVRVLLSASPVGVEGSPVTVFGAWTASLIVCMALVATSCSVLQSLANHFLMAFIGIGVAWKMRGADER